MREHSIPSPNLGFSETIPSFPVIVKPISEGSSIGVEILATKQDYTAWNKSQEQAHQYFLKRIVMVRTSLLV